MVDNPVNPSSNMYRSIVRLSEMNVTNPIRSAGSLGINNGSANRFGCTRPILDRESTDTKRFTSNQCGVYDCGNSKPIYRNAVDDHRCVNPCALQRNALGNREGGRPSRGSGGNRDDIPILRQSDSGADIGKRDALSANRGSVARFEDG